MKHIKLTKGLTAIVDDEDYEILNQRSWCAIGGIYAARRKTISRGKTKMVYMHREILNPPEGMFTDHINGNKRDNRKCNLRVCTKSENAMGFQKKKTGTSSKFIGVSWNKEKNRWESYITTHGKTKKVGYYKNEVAAALSRDCFSINRGIEFINLNFKTLQDAIVAARKLPGDMTAR